MTTAPTAVQGVLSGSGLVKSYRRHRVVDEVDIEFLRLVRLGPYPLDAYLDGLLLIYRHRDAPGLIGFIGTVLGRHRVNIAHMALGRKTNKPGGDSVAVLNLDSAPSPEALTEIAGHAEVSGVEVVKLPPAGAPLPWLVQ